MKKKSKRLNVMDIIKLGIICGIWVVMIFMMYSTYHYPDCVKKEVKNVCDSEERNVAGVAFTYDDTRTYYACQDTGDGIIYEGQLDSSRCDIYRVFSLGKLFQ